MKKVIGYTVGAVVAAGIGFLVRGLMPAGGAPAGMAARYGNMPPPAVKVQTAQLQNTAPIKEYIAQVQPIRAVQLKSQISGTIAQVHFTEGSMVTKGDLLFTIEPAEYEARVAQARAALTSAQADQTRADKFLKMYQTADARSISQSAMDEAEANALDAQASVLQAESDLKLAEINLSYTQIRAPISGKIGQALITEGNYVSPGNGTLAEIVQLDPIRVVFSLPDADYLNLVQRFGVEERNVGIAKVVLPNGTELETHGARDFESNMMNEGTGTIAVHLRFSNPQQLLVPNGYVSVRFQRNDTDQKIMLPQSAILRDANGAYVWTLNEENVAAQARIITGEMSGINCVIESGLEPGQTVVVSGIQKVRPGSPVQVIPTAITTDTK